MTYHSSLKKDPILTNSHIVKSSVDVDTDTDQQAENLNHYDQAMSDKEQIDEKKEE